jgi:hypothetical protein
METGLIIRTRKALQASGNKVRRARSAGARLYKADLARFSILAGELGLLILVVRLCKLEGGGFGDLAVLAWMGFVIHHFLPMRMRLPFFVALSLGGLALITGWWTAGWVILVGLLLIGMCHLPIRWPLRLGLLALAGVVLAALRLEWLTTHGRSIWPVLGWLFMFRLPIYLYELRHRTAPFTPSRTFTYFFLLSNACFPLFPWSITAPSVQPATTASLCGSQLGQEGRPGFGDPIIHDSLGGTPWV